MNGRMVHCKMIIGIDELSQKQDVLTANKESMDLCLSDIAHKFNNILTVIMGNVALAKKQVNQNDKIYEKLTEVELASLQAKKLMQRLQTFPRETLIKGEW